MTSVRSDKELSFICDASVMCQCVMWSWSTGVIDEDGADHMLPAAKSPHLNPTDQLSESVSASVAQYLSNYREFEPSF